MLPESGVTYQFSQTQQQEAGLTEEFVDRPFKLRAKEFGGVALPILSVILIVAEDYSAMKRCLQTETKTKT